MKKILLFSFIILLFSVSMAQQYFPRGIKTPYVTGLDSIILDDSNLTSVTYGDTILTLEKGKELINDTSNILRSEWLSDISDSTEWLSSGDSIYPKPAYNKLGVNEIFTDSAYINYAEIGNHMDSTETMDSINAITDELITDTSQFARKADTANFLSYDFETVSRTIYIETTGDDITGDGSIGNPFATFTRAIKDIDEIFNEGIIVTLHPGAGSFNITKEDIYLLNKLYTSYSQNITILGDTTVYESGITWTTDPSDPFKQNVSSHTFTTNEHSHRFLTRLSYSYLSLYPICENGTDYLISTANSTSYNAIAGLNTTLVFDDKNYPFKSTTTMTIRGCILDFNGTSTMGSSVTTINLFGCILLLNRGIGSPIEKTPISLNTTIVLTNYSSAQNVFYNGSIINYSIVEDISGSTKTGIFIGGGVYFSNSIVKNYGYGVDCQFGNPSVLSRNGVKFIDCGTVFYKTYDTPFTANFESIYLDNVDYLFNLPTDYAEIKIDNIVGSYTQVFNPASTYKKYIDDEHLIYLYVPDSTDYWHDSLMANIGKFDIVESNISILPKIHTDTIILNNKDTITDMKIEASTDFTVEIAGKSSIQAYVDSLKWNIAGVEKMRLDASGNLGIGITPSEKLDVNGNSIVDTSKVRDALKIGDIQMKDDGDDLIVTLPASTDTFEVNGVYKDKNGLITSGDTSFFNYTTNKITNKHDTIESDVFKNDSITIQRDGDIRSNITGGYCINRTFSEYDGVTYASETDRNTGVAISLGQVWLSANGEARLICDDDDTIRVTSTLKLGDQTLEVTNIESLEGSVNINAMVVIDSFVIADIFKFLVPDTQYYSITSSDFTTTYPDINDVGIGPASVTASADGISFHMAIHLPDNAEIVEVILYGNAGAQAETYSVGRYALNSDAAPTVLATENIGTADNTISSGVIDNSQYRYSLYTSTLDTGDSFYGGRIKYIRTKL